MRKKLLEYEVIIEQDENGVYFGHVPQLPGCHTEGDTTEELMENMQEAIELYLEFTKEKVENPTRFVGVRKIAVPKPSVA